MEDLSSNTKFSQGDVVVYKASGICEITDIKNENFDGAGIREFYMLRSVYDPRMQVFVPVNSELAAKMKPLLSEEDIKKIIYEAISHPMTWIENSKERVARFTDILICSDREQILKLFKLLSLKKKELEAQKKQLHAGDSRLLARAEKAITEEFSYVLGISRDKVIGYIDSFIAG